MNIHDVPIGAAFRYVGSDTHDEKEIWIRVEASWVQKRGLEFGFLSENEVFMLKLSGMSFRRHGGMGNKEVELVTDFGGVP